MPHRLPVPRHQAYSLAAQHDQAGFEHGDALGRVGITAPVIEQLPVERHLKRALAHGHQQNINLALAEIPFGAVRAQVELALGR